MSERERKREIREMYFHLDKFFGVFVLGSAKLEYQDVYQHEYINISSTNDTPE